MDATETRQRKESGEEQKSTSTTTMSKRTTEWGLRRWKRFSPLQLLRFIRDTYVTGCVSAGNNVHLKGMAQHAAIFHIPDDAFSRQSSQRDDGDAKLLQALSRQSSQKDESQGLQAQQKKITPIVFSADQVCFSLYDLVVLYSTTTQCVIWFSAFSSTDFATFLMRSQQDFHTRFPPSERALSPRCGRS